MPSVCYIESHIALASDAVVSTDTWESLALGLAKLCVEEGRRSQRIVLSVGLAAVQRFPQTPRSGIWR